MFTRFLLFMLIISSSAAGQETRSSLLTALKKSPTDTSKVTLLNSISKSYVGSNNDSAIYYANQSVSLSLNLNSELYEGRAQNTLSAAYINAGKYDLAVPPARKAKQIGEEESNAAISGSAYHNLGNIYRMLQATDSSIYFYSQALEYRTALHDSAGTASSLGGLGVCYYQKGDFKKSLEYYYKVVPIREALHDTKGLASAYFNIALIHVDRKEKAPALEVLSKSYDLYSQLDNAQALASVTNTIGIVYVDDQNYEQGRTWYRKSLEMRMQINDSAGVAECYTNLGNVFVLEKKYDSAFVWYRKTIKMMHVSDEMHQFNYLCNYAIAATALGKTDSAQWAISQARLLMAKENRPDMRMSLYGTLSEYYEKSGLLDSALLFTRMYFSLQDSLYRNENLKTLGELETKYETTKKQKSIDNLVALQKQKDLQILAALVGIGLLVVLGAYVIYGSVQRKKSNRLLEVQNKEISIKNKDITDSINYARRIQQSVLPDEAVLFKNVNEAFLFYKPRDIVSGDFYWFRKEGARLYVACADCTGHGVPGALVSVVGVNILEQILDANHAITTGELLNQLHRMTIQALNKDAHARESNDGMDIAVLCFDTSAGTVEFSGACRPIYKYNGNELVQVKGDRSSIGGVKDFDDQTSFTTNKFPLVKDEAFFMFTDGYADQFGGPQNKKFMSRQFADLIGANVKLPMVAQEQRIATSLVRWQGQNEQVDDILVIGIRV